ncbi:MAG TPA: putative dsRNA-binding protein [Trueperaceae bacterium]|nr:putative dsRNA-binding protein [Trueperaceae bacterium]
MAEAHPKGVLLERAQKLGMGRPEFRTERTGPEHEPSFLSDVIVDGEVLGTGQGGSKRTAEKNAADEALAALDARETPAVTHPASAGSRKRGRGAKAQAADRTTPTQASAETQASSGAGRSEPRREAHGAADAETAGDEADDDSPFAGPWPMFDDLLASVLIVAEKRVSVELRGDAARIAIRDFSLTLYKELLADLGEVVEEDEEEED